MSTRRSPEYPEVPDAAMIVRNCGPSVEAISVLREVLASTAPDVPVSTPSTLLEQFAAILMPQRFAATLLSVFGLAALALAAVGVYGAPPISSRSGLARSACASRWARCRGYVRSGARRNRHADRRRCGRGIRGGRQVWRDWQADSFRA